jgi:hypothetical protein
MANQNNRILRNMGKGFIAGAWVGAEKGFVGSEILGGAETGGLIGVPGAIVGGFVGGVIGAGGALLGTFFGNLGNQALSDFQFNQRLHDNIKKNCGVNVTVVGHP